MENNEELFQTTLGELSTIASKLSEISKVENSFETRLNTLKGEAEGLVSRHNEILAEIDLLHGAINDVSSALASLSGLEDRIKELSEKLSSLDIQGLKDKLDGTSNDVAKASAKLLAAEKRDQAAKDKKIKKK